MAGHGRPKGTPKPANSGRKPGSVNKSTRDVREAIAEFARANVQNMSAWLEAVEPGRRMELYLRALEYHIPKASRAEAAGTDSGPTGLTLGSGQLTPEIRAEFLRRYAQGGTVREHAHALGVSHIDIFHLKNQDEEFEKEFLVAQNTNTDLLEDHLVRMATTAGTPGNVNALFGTLRARRPNVWRENLKVEHGGTVLTTTADQLEAARERVKAARAETTH